MRREGVGRDSLEGTSGLLLSYIGLSTSWASQVPHLAAIVNDWQPLLACSAAACLRRPHSRRRDAEELAWTAAGSPGTAAGIRRGVRPPARVPYMYRHMHVLYEYIRYILLLVDVLESSSTCTS